MPRSLGPSPRTLPADARRQTNELKICDSLSLACPVACFPCCRLLDDEQTAAADAAAAKDSDEADAEKQQLVDAYARGGRRRQNRSLADRGQQPPGQCACAYGVNYDDTATGASCIHAFVEHAAAFAFSSKPSKDLLACYGCLMTKQQVGPLLDCAPASVPPLQPCSKNLPARQFQMVRMSLQDRCCCYCSYCCLLRAAAATTVLTARRPRAASVIITNRIMYAGCPGTGH